jgi:hypothetical protein
MSPGAQNMKTGPVALNTVENESGRAKKKTGLVALAIAENESWSAKHHNGNRRPRYRRKRVRARKTLKRDPPPSVPLKISPAAQNMKTGPVALGTAENESGRTNLKNGTRHPRYRRKLVRARTT